MSRRAGRRWHTKPGQGIKRSGARLTIGAECEDGFEVVRAVTVTLWPGRHGARKVALGKIEQPMSDANLAAFVGACRKRILAIVGDVETTKKLTAELQADLDLAQARDASARFSVEGGELVDPRFGIPLSPALSAAWRKFLGDG